MPSASNYSQLVTIQTAHREHVSAGTQETWTDLRTIRASCEYDAQLWRPENQSAGEGDVFWIIRSRDNMGDARASGKTRFLVRINGRLTVLYPKGFPVLKGNEWFVRTQEEDDMQLPDPNFNRQGNW